MNEVNDSAHRPMRGVVIQPDAGTQPTEVAALSRPGDIASDLLQFAANFRSGKIKAFGSGLGVDAAYCDAAAIVVEELAKKAQREGWTRTL